MKSKLQVGDKAPDLRLREHNGRSVALSDYWENGRFAHLIFLRHLA